jgi:hypothetical protein
LHFAFALLRTSASVGILQRLEADKDDSFLAAKWADGSSLKSAVCDVAPSAFASKPFPYAALRYPLFPSFCTDSSPQAPKALLLLHLALSTIPDGHWKHLLEAAIKRQGQPCMADCAAVCDSIAAVRGSDRADRLSALWSVSASSALASECWMHQ